MNKLFEQGINKSYTCFQKVVLPAFKATSEEQEKGINNHSNKLEINIISSVLS